MSTDIPCFPRLPDILDGDSLAALSTLESRELAFCRRGGRHRHQYLRALYLKGFQALGHGHYQPRQMPRQLRARVAEQLGTAVALADILVLDKRERSRVVSEVREFMQCRRTTKALQDEVQTWLTDNVAEREDELSVLLSAAAERFVELHIEVPPFDRLAAVAETALCTANAAIERRLAGTFDDAVADGLLVIGDGQTRSWLDELKEPAGKASENRLELELRRLERLARWQPNELAQPPVHHSKIAELAALGRRYNASELRHLNPVKRRAIVASFCLERYAEQLDRIADMLVRLWQETCTEANAHADNERATVSRVDETHRAVLRDLLRVIVTSKGPGELWRGIRGYKDNDDYAAMRVELDKLPSRSDLYIGKLLNHYSAMRRFLPLWYRLAPLVATTSDSSLVRAMAVLRDQARLDSTELPVQGTPVSFLSQQWDSRAIRRFRRTGQVTRIHKASYELGCLEATTEALVSGSVALRGARRFAPMTDHLLDREAFLDNYEAHLETLGLPTQASDYYGKDRDELIERFPVMPSWA